ncbi:MAG TPA: nuclear transport factor 2 family protein [Gammaproteobacteria bacterium]|nr:nuclear transport factor 2 family protein [Gammaproteobacteria bacterium]
MKTGIILMAGLLVVLLSGCQQHADTASVQTGNLLKADKAFSEASLKEGFAAAFSRDAATDAVLLPQGGAAVNGKLQIAQSLAGIPSDTKVSWSPQAGDVSGNLGYTWGIYTVAGINADGRATVAYGKYLSVWKRQDGDWKLTIMMTNQSPGPTG